MIDILLTYKEAFLKGFGVTMQLCMIAWLLGIIFGVILGYYSARFKVVVGIPVKMLSNGISAVPVIVFLFWLHYPFQYMLNISIDPFITSALTLTIINLLGISTLVRTAIVELPEQYIIAAKTLGIPNKIIFKKIQFPLIFRQIIPTLIILEVNILHTSLFSSFISVPDLFRQVQNITSIAQKPIEIYTGLGLFFLLICLPLNWLASFLKNKYTRNISER